MFSDDGIYGQGETYSYFLWRRLARAGAWSGGVPDLLASDGQRVRHMTVGDRILVLQQYDDPPAAQAVARMVQAQASNGRGLRGYSMFRNAESVAIWQSPGESESSWAAFPFADFPWHAALLDQLPAHTAAMPRVRLCGGTRLRWAHGRLMLEAAIEQRGDAQHACAGDADLLQFLTEWRIEAFDISGADARLVTPGKSPNVVHRVAPRRIETRWALNTPRNRALGDLTKLRAWFVLTFDARLFSLPDPWRTWWFEVDLPGQVEL